MQERRAAGTYTSSMGLLDSSFFFDLLYVVDGNVPCRRGGQETELFFFLVRAKNVSRPNLIFDDRHKTSGTAPSPTPSPPAQLVKEGRRLAALRPRRVCRTRGTLRRGRLPYHPLRGRRHPGGVCRWGHQELLGRRASAAEPIPGHPYIGSGRRCGGRT